jgi:hypothetical protein
VDIEKTIRILARSIFYQNIYKSAKEIGSIHLFENKTNLSGIQTLFLFWLSVYETLYSELGQKEWKYLDEKVIDNDLRCDAFLYWRGQFRETEIDNNKREQKINKLKFKEKGDVSTFNVDYSG